MIPPETVDVLATFCPDPWPKPSQQWRRLINDSFTELVASRLRPGGQWRVATDTNDYALQALGAALACESLHVPGAAFTSRDDRLPLTKYERRGIRDGRTIHYFRAFRRPG